MAAENLEGDTTQKTTQKTIQRILDAIRKDPAVSRTKLAEACGISSDGVKWQFTSVS